MNRRLILCIAAALTVGACSDQQEPTTESQNPGSDFASASSTVGINVVLKGRATAAQLSELGKYGAVKKQFPQINGLTLAGKAGNLASIRRLSFVKGAAIDKFIDIPPNTDLVNVTDFTSGFSSWDQDAIDVTIQPLSSARDVAQTGRGVFVGILDTGLLNTWPQYFPTERIATQYATSFVGGGAADRGTCTLPEETSGSMMCAPRHSRCQHDPGLSSQPHPQDSGHRSPSHRDSRMLHSQGSANTPNSCGFFSSVAAAGLIYFGDLKAKLGGLPWW